MISEVFIKILEELKQLNCKLAPSEWESIAQAVKILGIPRNELMTKIHKGEIPWRLNGTRYSLNIKLVREYLEKEDIRNMEAIKKDIDRCPIDRRRSETRKVAKNQANPGIRRVR